MCAARRTGRRRSTWCEQNWGGLDILVNNAGIATGGRIDVESLDEWDRVVDINLMGVVRGCRAFTPVFKRQRSGHIVNTASAAGLVHPPMMSSYNTVKAGVVALSETLSHELHPYDVTVSVVCPSFFRTNLGDSIQGDDTAMSATARQLIEKSPRSADDIAAGVITGIKKKQFLIIPDRPALAGLADQAVRPAAVRPADAQDRRPGRAASGPSPVMGDGAAGRSARRTPSTCRWWTAGSGTDRRCRPGLPEVKQFSGGASNRTYRLRYAGHDLILRRPPAGTKAKSAHDMGREYRIQRASKPVFPYVPEMVAHCNDTGGDRLRVLRDGADRRHHPAASSELGVDLTPEQTRQLCSHADRHAGRAAPGRLPAPAGLDRPRQRRGYVERQVDGWTDRYRKARTWNVPSFERRDAPGCGEPARAMCRTCVIHNDFRLDNVVLDAG